MDFARLVPKPNQVAVFFFAGVVLLSETVLFHTTKFVLDYILATTVVGCAVAGIGLGAFLASRLKCREADIFGRCCGGTTFCLYLAAYVLLRHPDLFLLLPAVATVFVFPSTFIARTFTRRDAATIYFFDMLGAGTAVVLTVVAYQYLDSETIYLVILTAVPLAGALWTGFARSRHKPPRGPWTRLSATLWLLLLSTVGGTLLYRQANSHALNIIKLVNPDAANIPAQSALRRPSRYSVTRTYDSLVGRIDAMPDANRVFVCYDGFFNDNFFDTQPRDYLEFAKPHKLRFPSADRRVAYGLVSEPSVFVIGPAATGILKTLREFTPVDRIDAVEINPGILQMMLYDFFDASGRAYEGVDVRPGNALSVLQRSDHEYDMITLINTHSSRWIGALGAPDYLHTRESYDLYLDHLTEDGYLLFEERPDTWQGELGLKRMILTLYDCLKRRGIKDPAEHFFVWEFMSNRYFNMGLEGIQPGSDMYYVGMVVSLKPLVGQRKQDLIDWCNIQWLIEEDERGEPIHYPYQRRMEASYLKGEYYGARFGPFFDMIESGDFSQLDQDFDASIVTNDRPFPSCATRSIPAIARLVRITTGVCFLLGVLFTLGALQGTKHRSRIGMLVLYNIAIGCAYFLVEIMLIQAYQGVFLSPSASLVLVLGVLLIGSGFGGLASRHIPPWLATLTLGPVLLLSLRVPAWVLKLGVDLSASSLLAALAVFVVGANMGVYFPKGLQLARRWSLRSKIPHLFAINSISGSLATILSFYLAVRVGYTWTIILAFLLYILAAVIYRRAHALKRKLDSPAHTTSCHGSMQV